MVARADQSKTVFALGVTGEFGADVQGRRLKGEAPDVMWRTLFGEARPENVILEQLATMADGQVYVPQQQVSGAEACRWVKEAAMWFGAALVGITRLNPDYVYSHRGMKSDLREGRFGEQIDLDHRWAISLAVPMDYDKIKASPSYLADAEVAMGYVRVGIAACMLAAYIRELGYEARAHYLRREEVLQVPVAVDAGLGEMGRNGFLITARYGPRVRLATVTTNLQLVADQQVDLGVTEFCRRCELCAEHCPSQSIPRGEQEPDQFGRRWIIDPVTCYKWWNAKPDRWGSCANCISSCPWDKPDTWYHGLAVAAVRRFKFAVWPLLWLEKLLYHRSEAKGYRWLHYQAGQDR